MNITHDKTDFLLMSNSDYTQNKTGNTIFLAWEKIKYCIQPEDFKDKNQGRVILNNIFGCAIPGQVLAIMGPSGCGKTSLLNIIADRQLPENREKHKINRIVKFN
jgi:ABC-type nitrate/sulfonate/bicarbonate transport system ATPase subunit